MTIPTRLVLRALLSDPLRELYGVEIGRGQGPPLWIIAHRSRLRRNSVPKR